MRQLLRHKTYGVINMLGLAVGLACCILIGFYIKYEFGYNAFHKKAERIYHVVLGAQDVDRTPYYTMGGFGAIAALLKEDLPEAEEVVRTFTLPMVVKKDGQVFEFHQCTADSNFFRVFTFPLLKGNPDHVLAMPGAMVISQRMSQTLFGDTDPIGQPLTVAGNVYLDREYYVAGIMQNVPTQSHLQFDCVTASRNNNPMMREAWKRRHGGRGTHIYLLLKDGVDVRGVREKVSFTSVRMNTLNWREEELLLDIQPLKDVYLFSALRYGIIGMGDIRWLWVLTALCLGILAIVCINYTNLAVASSLRRVRELGVRRAIGATRLQVALQFLGESILFSVFSGILAVCLVILIWPQISTFVGKPIFANLNFLPFLSSFLIFIFLVGLAGGIYPTFFANRLGIAQAARNRGALGFGRWQFMRFLILIQFAMTMILISGAEILMKQMDYVKNKDLGYKRGHVVILDFYLKDRSLLQKSETIQAAFKNHPNVLSLSASFRTMNTAVTKSHFIPGDQPAREMTLQAADENFAETYGIEVVAGRFFSKEHPADVHNAFVLNEAAARALGWEDPIGKPFKWTGRREGRIIGVVRDFHFESLRSEIQPLVMVMWPRKHFYISVRMRSEHIEETLHHLKAVWDHYLPGRAFDYQFLDDALDQYYRFEIKIAKVIRIARWIAVLMAGMGLAGLMSLFVQQRMKEIAVRRVVGASVTNIVVLLCRPVVFLAAVGFVLSVPVGYWFMTFWLSGFVYHTGVGVTPFALSLFIGVVIGLATALVQAIHATSASPVQVLRRE